MAVKKTDHRPEQQPTIDHRPMAVKNTDHQPEQQPTTDQITVVQPPTTNHIANMLPGQFPLMRQALS